MGTLLRLVRGLLLGLGALGRCAGGIVKEFCSDLIDRSNHARHARRRPALSAAR